MQKRIKSFLITASSLIGTSFVAILTTPEWANFVLFTNNKLIALGVPTVIVSVIGVFISEVWKGILNKKILEKQTLIAGSAEDVNEVADVHPLAKLY